ncbi:hypothetical protein BJX76DRAFT_299887 [Aspergillus varians]
MAESRQRRTLLTTTLQTLRNTLKKHFNHKFGRNSLDSTPNMQNWSASMPARKGSDISSYNSQPSGSIRTVSAPHHYRSLYSSDDTDKENERERKHNETSPEPSRVTTALRIRHLASRLNPLEAFPRTQTSVGLSRRSRLASSRLPTPTEPPKDEIYSHSVYQKEGRRSVLSSLGRRWAMKPRETPNIPQSRTRRSTIQGNNTIEHPTPNILVIRRLSAQHNGDSNTPTVVKVSTPAPAQAAALAAIRKERARRDSESNNNGDSQFLLPRYYQTRNRLSSFGPPDTSGNIMASPPKRIRLTQGFENLKKSQELQRTKLPMPKQNPETSLPRSTSAIVTTNLRLQTHEQVKENAAPTTCLPALHPLPALPPPYGGVDTNRSKRAKELGSKLPRVSPGSTRRKIQIEKMVPTPPPPPRDSHHTIHVLGQVPSSVSNPRTRPELTWNVNSRAQIETAMPEGYWLGRFMTLTNAFHYEDSFNEPDIATGFEIPSSYSRPFKGSDDGDLAGYRIKRAFMVLENFCVTEEASASLQEFREGYICRFGDWWMT